MGQFTGAIFDLDGTMLDSMWIWDQIDIDFLARRGFDVPADYQAAIAPLGTEACAAYTIERFHLDEKPEDLIREWMDMAYDAYANKLLLKEGVLEFLHELHRKGIPMAVATSSDLMLVEPCLIRTGLMPLLETVVTVSDVARGKHFPDVYEEAARRLNRSVEECLVFEDIIEAARGAKMGGFSIVGVYDGANKAEAIEALKQEADYFIHSFRELPEMNLF